MASKFNSKNAGYAIVGILILAALVFRDLFIDFLFVDYQKWLNDIGRAVALRPEWLPAKIYGNMVGTVGFLLLGAALVLIPALLGVRKAWIVVGLVILGLLLSGWNEAIGHTAFGPHGYKEYVSSIGPWLLYSMGSLVGAAVSEWAVFKFGGRSSPKRGKKSNKKGASH